LGHVILDTEPGFSVDAIESGTFDVSAINLVDAVRTEELPVVTSVVPGSFGRRRVTGRVTNLGSGTVRNPDVAIFGVNLVGRPLFFASDVDILTIPRGGSWSFSATPEFEGEYASLVSFADASD